MTSVQEIKALILDVVDCLPRGPIQQAVDQLDQQIARLQGAMDGSNDGEIQSAIAALQAAREQLAGGYQVMSGAEEPLQGYAGRI